MSRFVYNKYDYARDVKKSNRKIGFGFVFAIFGLILLGLTDFFMDPHRVFTVPGATVGAILLGAGALLLLFGFVGQRDAEKYKNKYGI